jgi:hypothetical protein
VNRTGNLFTFLCFQILLISSVFASDFSVNNVTVDVKAENSIEARNTAMIKARRNAYDILLSRLLDVNERTRFNNADDSIISSLVDNFEINREKLSQKRYLANISINFNPQAVQAYLGRTQNMPSYNDDSGSYTILNGQAPKAVLNETSLTHSKTILLLPWYGQGNDVTLWRESNLWKNAWDSYLSSTPSTQNFITLPIGDITDIQSFNPKKPLSFDKAGLNRLLKRYNADFALIAMADTLSNNMTRVSVYQSTNMTPRFIDRFVTKMTESESFNSLYPAIYKTLDTIKKTSFQTAPSLNDTNIAINETPSFAVDNTVSTPIEAEIRLNSLQQWIGIKQSLNLVDGISNMNIKSLSANRAVISFRFSGNDNDLRQALKLRGLNFYNNPDRINGASPYVITG